MKVASYGRDKVEELFEFNDENGKYVLKGDSIKIIINSWNLLMTIYTGDDYQMTANDIKLLHKVFTTLYFQKEVDDND